MASSQNIKFAKRIEQRWRPTRALSNGVGQSGGRSTSVPCFPFFKPYRIQPGTRTGRCLRSGRLSVLLSALAGKAINSRALALSLLSVVSVLSAGLLGLVVLEF